MINKNNISIGTVQFAVNTEQNSYLLAEHPLGSISRMFANLISENLSFLGIKSDTASLIISKPEENTHKQLMYTSMLPIENAIKIFEGQHYDYLVFGELKFENILKVDITLINRFNDKSIRRELSIKNYDFLNLSIKIINEVFKLSEINIDNEKLNQLIKYSSNDLKAWGWYSLSYEEELDNNDQITALEKATSISPDFRLAEIKKLLLQVTEHNDVKHLEEHLKDTDNLLINYFAQQFELKNEYLIALNLYKISYTKDNLQEDVLFKIIKLSYENNLSDYFNKYLDLYLRDTSDNNFNFEEIPFYIYLSGKEDIAINKLKQGIELYPNSSRIHSTLAYIYMSRNALSEADKEYEKSFSLYKNANILEDWTSVLIKTGNYKKVIEVINQNIDDLPFNSGLSCNLALAYLSDDNKEKAIKSLEKAVKHDKDNTKLNSLLGSIYLEQKSYSRAQKYFYLALQAEPNNYVWYINMGNLFFEQQDFDEAEKYYSKAVELNKDIKVPQLLICDAAKLEKSEKFQEAINKYMKSSKVLTDNFLPILKVSEIFVKTGDIDQAIEILEKYSEKFLNTPELWNQLHNLYKQKETGFFKKRWKNKSEEALSKYNQLIK